MVVAGKVALITGGASGFGLAVVKELLKNGAKAGENYQICQNNTHIVLQAVAIADISETNGLKALQELKASFGPEKAMIIKTDVTIKEELEAAFEKTVQAYNQLDVVFNNAGIADENNWEKVINVNLTAVMRSCYLALQTYLPKYKSGEEGLIVNTSSVLGLKTLMTSAPSYNVTKRGLTALGEVLGSPKFYNDRKVRVVTICPGVIDTPLAEPLKPHMKAAGMIVQKPEIVAGHLMKVLEEGQNGSLWILEDEKPGYEVRLQVVKK